MSNLLLIILFTSVLCVNAQSANQSTQKIGYAETDYILNQLPEFKKMNSELQTYYNQLQEQMKLKGDELQAKQKSYQSIPANTPNAVRADKERELATLQQSLEKFKNDAQASFQKKQSDSLSPMYSKIGNAIEQVAKENEFAFIINHKYTDEGQILLFWDEKFNISDLVLKKLGVVPTPRRSLKLN